MRADLGVHEILAAVRRTPCGCTHFEATSRQLARLDVIDSQLQHLTRTLEEQRQAAAAQAPGLRDEAVEAMIQTAAEQAASRLMTTLPVPEAKSGERIDALEGMMQDYIAERRRGDEATCGMLQTIEEALIRTLGAFDLGGIRYEGLTGVWMPPTGSQGPRKVASIGVHVSRWVTTHGYALNVDLDPAPFTEWITACGLEDAAFTTLARELGRPVTVAEARPHAAAALEEVFGLAFEELPAEEGAGLWPQPIHASLTA